MNSTAARFLSFSLLLASVNVASAQSGTIKIGLILPASGVYAQLGEKGTKGFNLYMDSIGNKVAGKTL